MRERAGLGERPASRAPRGLPLIGLSFVDVAAAASAFACPGDLPAFAVAPSPWFHRETLRFRVVALDACGMTFSASGCAPLLPGMELDFALHLRYIGVAEARARVGGDAVQAGYRFVLGACDDDRLGMYREMGYELLETREVEPKPGWRFRSHLIALDVERVVSGAVSGRAVEDMAAAARLAGHDAPPTLAAAA